HRPQGGHEAPPSGDDEPRLGDRCGTVRRLRRRRAGGRARRARVLCRRRPHRHLRHASARRTRRRRPEPGSLLPLRGQGPGSGRGLRRGCPVVGSAVPRRRCRGHRRRPDRGPYIPSVPQWVIALAIMLVFTAINLTASGSFGEFEFWFSLIKVAFVGLFLLLGLAYLLGWTPADPPAQIFADGFMPTGVSGVAAGLLVVAFAFGGIEIVAV